MDIDKTINIKKRILRDLELRGFFFRDNVKKAFLETDRANFVPPPQINRAYIDTPLPIGYGQTISAIHMVLMMISKETGDPLPGDHVLEIGTGSGYNAAILSRAVDPNGENKGLVVSYERIFDLIINAKQNLEKEGLFPNLYLICGDGSNAMFKKEIFDLIIVTAASPQIPPPLIDILKVGGRIVIPVGSRYIQSLVTAKKKEDGTLEQRKEFGVMFVPLIGKHGFKNRL